MSVMRLEFNEPVSVGSGGLDAVTAVEVTADVLSFEGDHVAFWHGNDQLGRIPTSTLARVAVQQDEDRSQRRRPGMARPTWQPGNGVPAANGYGDTSADELAEYQN